MTIVSCSKEETPDVIGEDGLITITQEVILEAPATRANSLSGKPIKGTITAIVNIEQENIIQYSISQEILDEMDMTLTEFDFYLREILGEDYTDMNKMMSGEITFTSNASLTTSINLSACLKDCHERFTDENGDKIKGRGACKAGCWVDTVVKVVITVLPFLV